MFAEQSVNGGKFSKLDIISCLVSTIMVKPKSVDQFSFVKPKGLDHLDQLF